METLSACQIFNQATQRTQHNRRVCVCAEDGAIVGALRSALGEHHRRLLYGQIDFIADTQNRLNSNLEES
jgi:hypothetical protein